MALVDPNIALSGKPLQFESPTNMLAQAYQLQNAAQANRLNQMKMAEYERARQEEEGIRNYLQGRGLNAPMAQNELLRFGKTGLEYAKQLQAQQTAALQQRSAQLKFQTDMAEAAGRIYMGVKDQATWDAAKPRLAALGGDASALPAAYDPEFIRSELGQAQSVKDQFELTKPKIEQVRANDRVVFRDINPRSPTFGQETLPAEKMGVAPGEAERIGLERQRVGLESQRVGLAQQEAQLKREGIEGIAPKELQKRNAALPQAKSSVESFESKTDSFIKDLEKLRDDPGLDQITGPVYGRTPSVSREGSRAQAQYNKIFAKGGFQALQDLREASKTGGALGNVSNEEGRRLERSIVGGLDRTQNIADVKQGINDLIEDLKVSKARVRNTFDETYSYRNPQQTAAPAAPAAALPPGFKLDK